MHLQVLSFPFVKPTVNSLGQTPVPQAEGRRSKTFLVSWKAISASGLFH